MTTVIIAAAIVLVIAVGLLVQGEDPVPSARETRSATVKHERAAREQAPRSARVEERLQRMREGGGAQEKPMRQGEMAGAPRVKEQRPDAQAMLPTQRRVESDDSPESEDIEDEVRLAETIRTNPDPEERASAVFFLTGGESRTVLPVLLEALGDPDPEVRLAAVEALDDYSDDLKPETLVPALSDADAEVRFEALGVLGDLDDEDAVRDIAKKMLNDPDDDVRSLAEGILDMEDGS